MNFKFLYFISAIIPIFIINKKIIEKILIKKIFKLINEL